MRELRYVQHLKQGLPGRKNQLRVLAGGGGCSHALVLGTASEILDLVYALPYTLCPQAEGILWPKLHKGKRSTCSPVISPALYLQQFSPTLKYEPVEPERNPKKILQRTSFSDISSSPDYFFLSPSPSFHFYLEKCFFLHSQTDLLNRWLANSSDLIWFIFGHIPWLSDLSSPTWVRTWAMAVKRVNSHH